MQVSVAAPMIRSETHNRKGREKQEETDNIENTLRSGPEP